MQIVTYSSHKSRSIKESWNEIWSDNRVELLPKPNMTLVFGKSLTGRTITMPRNYYDVLAVKSGDSPDVIKQAYRKLAKENHPDLHPADQMAEERFKEIGEAWATLGDRQKREAYDRKLAGDRKDNRKPPKAPIGKVDLQDLMRGFERYFNEDSIGAQPSGKKAAPVDTTAIFEQFMGIKSPGKK